MSTAGDQLKQISLFNPKATATLQQVQTATVTLDWNEQPVAQAILHLPGNEGATELAGLVNMGITFARSMGGKKMDPQVADLVKNLAARPSEAGVEITLAVPAETAEDWISKASPR
jgi:hypothetical protein